MIKIIYLYIFYTAFLRISHHTTKFEGDEIFKYQSLVFHDMFEKAKIFENGKECSSLAVFHSSDFFWGAGMQYRVSLHCYKYLVYLSYLFNRIKTWFMFLIPFAIKLFPQQQSDIVQCRNKILRREIFLIHIK